MSQDLSFLEDESLTDNLSDEVAKKINLWLESLAKSDSPIFQQMLEFVKAFNRAKAQPISHKGKYLNNLFEIVVCYTSSDANVVTRFANHLIEQGAVYVPQERKS